MTCGSWWTERITAAMTLPGKVGRGYARDMIVYLFLIYVL